MVSWDTRMLSSSEYWFSTIRKFVPGTSPESVYSQRCSATSRGWKAGSACALRSTWRLGCPLEWFDPQDGHHAVSPPGSRSIPFALNLWQSHGSTNRKPDRERFAHAHAA